MFDDADRLTQMHSKCRDYTMERLVEFLDANPGRSTDDIAECVRRAMEDFWLLHSGRVVEVGIIKRNYNDRREEA